MKACPTCSVKLKPLGIDENVLACRNTECNAVYQVDAKTGEVLTDSAII